MISKEMLIVAPEEGSSSVKVVGEASILSMGDVSGRGWAAVVCSPIYCGVYRCVVKRSVCIACKRVEGAGLPADGRHRDGEMIAVRYQILTRRRWRPLANRFRRGVAYRHKFYF